jgi:hypothetical protein
MATTSATLKRYDDLIGIKMRLDKFFTMFLDTYGKEMDSEKTETPIWKLYKAKLKEYEEVSKEIKSIEYWIKRKNIKLDEED